MLPIGVPCSGCWAVPPPNCRLPLPVGGDKLISGVKIELMVVELSTTVMFHCWAESCIDPGSGVRIPALNAGFTSQVLVQASPSKDEELGVGPVGVEELAASPLEPSELTASAGRSGADEPTGLLNHLSISSSPMPMLMFFLSIPLPLPDLTEEGVVGLSTKISSLPSSPNDGVDGGGLSRV